MFGAWRGRPQAPQPDVLETSALDLASSLCPGSVDVGVLGGKVLFRIEACKPYGRVGRRARGVLAGDTQYLFRAAHLRGQESGAERALVPCEEPDMRSKQGWRNWGGQLLDQEVQRCDEVGFLLREHV